MVYNHKLRRYVGWFLEVTVTTCMYNIIDNLTMSCIHHCFITLSEQSFNVTLWLVLNLNLFHMKTTLSKLPSDIPEGSNHYVSTTTYSPYFDLREVPPTLVHLLHVYLIHVPAIYYLA